jgi:hypothetical protein
MSDGGEIEEAEVEFYVLRTSGGRHVEIVMDSTYPISAADYMLASRLSWPNSKMIPKRCSWTPSLASASPTIEGPPLGRPHHAH